MIKIKKELFTNLKIRTQFLLILLIAISVSLGLFQFLWMSKWQVCEFGQQTGIFQSLNLSDDFFYQLHTEALQYEIPEDEHDKVRIDAIQPYLNLVDKYTSIYIYGLEDGTYRTGKFPTYLSESPSRRFFNTFYQVTNGAGEERYDFPLEFKNGYANVMITSYHRTRFIYPYYLFCFFASSGLFLLIMLYFIRRKMKSIIRLEQAVLQMSSGDLTTSVPRLGGDEIGILSGELDALRRSLAATIRQEQESRKANHDLITAMSHDLRTPLTILKGYQEVMRLNHNPKKHKEYLERCIKKTEEIQWMTDKMFEYALVYEEVERPDLYPAPCAFLRQCLHENAEFLALSGFQTDFTCSKEELEVNIDAAMIRRIFNNLFSNIIKYGNKKEPVLITDSVRSSVWKATICNSIDPNRSHPESTRIGLKSTEKMLEFMNGTISVQQSEDQFCVTLTLPSVDSSAQVLS